MIYKLPEILVIAALAEITADGNVTGVNTAHLDGALRFLWDAKNISGTTPTLGAKLQHSDDDVDGHYEDITGGAFVGATASAHTLESITLQRNEVKTWVRLVDDAGGTTPKFARLCLLEAHRKYPNDPVPNFS